MSAGAKTITFQFDGESFVLEGELTSGGPRRHAHAGGARLETLCTVVASAWFYGPKKLIDSVQARSGMSFEGVVSFAFPDGVEWLGPGVALSAFDAESTVGEDVFRRFVQAFGRACLELDVRLGVDRPDAAALARRLDSLGD